MRCQIMFAAILKYLTLCILPSPKFEVPTTSRNLKPKNAQKETENQSWTTRIPVKARPSRSKNKELTRMKNRHTICYDSILTPSSGRSDVLSFSSLPCDSFGAIKPIQLPDTQNLANTKTESRVEEAMVNTEGEKGKGKYTYYSDNLMQERDTGSHTQKERSVAPPTQVSSTHGFLRSQSQPGYSPWDLSNDTRQSEVSFNSTYAQKMFEAVSLSPILEDSRTSSEEPYESVDFNLTSLIESSGSSYGELLVNRTPGYDVSGYSFFPDWNSGDSVQVGSCLDDIVHKFEELEDSRFDKDCLASIRDSIIVPELTLTVPTPEIDGTEAHCTRQNDYCEALSNNQYSRTFSPSGFSRNSLDVGRMMKLKVVSESSRRSFPDYAYGTHTVDPSQYLQTFASETVSRNTADKNSTSVRYADATDKNRRFSSLSTGNWFLKRFSMARATTAPWINETDSPSDGHPVDCIPLLDDSTASSWHWRRRVNDHLEGSTNKRYSAALSASETRARVVEDGEHAASRLFGTPNIGTVVKKADKAVSKAGDETELKPSRRAKRLSLRGLESLWPLRRGL